MHRDQPPQAQKFFDQLVAYTQECAEKLKIPFDAKGRRNYRSWDAGYPTGHCTHFTASNDAVTKSRPMGRVPVLFRRFARRSGSPGVHLITWDNFLPQFDEIRAKYDVFEHLDCDVWCWGLDVAFYHGNDLNGFCVGNELRNLGRVIKWGDGDWGWGRKGKNSYAGRDPIKIRNMGFYEPFTRAQIEAVIVTNRWLKSLYPMEPSRFLGHLAVTSNRTDPFPHFPLQLVREAVFFDDRPLSQMDWLMAYQNDQEDFFERDDEYIEDLMESDEDDNVDNDVDLLDLWSRKSISDVEFEEEGVYGEDGVVTVGDVVEAKKALYHLGYYPFAWGPAFTAGDTDEYKWTIEMFQNRWVKKKGKKVIRYVKDTGVADRATVIQMNKMLKQFDLLPDD